MKKSKDKVDGIVKTVIPLFPDWNAADVWRLVYPNMYRTKSGKIKLRPFRAPDGEPTGYTAILSANGSHYYYTGDEEGCSCDQDGICRHWIPIRER